MYRCDRCGSSYNPMRGAIGEYCPRCLVRDRVNAQLTFKMFKLPERNRGGVPTKPTRP